MKSFVLTILLALMAVLAGCSSPKTVEDLRAAGKKAYLDEQYQQAREYFLKALAQKPSDKDLLYFLASAYQKDSMYDSALFYLDRSNILYPNDRETNFRIYKIAILLEKWEDAISAVNVMAEMDGNVNEHAGELSMLWANAGNAINAVYWSKRAIEHEPNNPQWYMILVQNAIPCDSLNLALTMLDTGLVYVDSTFRSQLQLQKAMLLVESGRHADAEKIMRPLLASDSSSTVFRHYLANALAGQSSRAKKEEALALFKDLQPLVPPEAGIDSMIVRLEKDLN